MAKKKFGLSCEPPNLYGSQEAPSLKLGGITIYGRSVESIEHGVSLAKNTIEKIAAAHLTIVRNVLAKALREELGLEEMDKRLLSALLGYTLRHGEIDALICVSKNDVPFRVFRHSSKTKAFEAALDWTRKRIAKVQSITVKEVEQHIFPQRKYNTWSSATHVIGRLAYLGVVVFEDDFSAHLVPLAHGE